MSRAYEISLDIHDLDPSKEEQVIAACCREWEFEPGDFDNDLPSNPNTCDLSVIAQGSLCGGETEEEFADRLAKAIWQANGGYCEVMVNATYLEAIPYETHLRDETDFARLNPEPEQETKLQPEIEPEPEECANRTIETGKFYRTVVEVEILSREPINFDDWSLDGIHREITEGDCSGVHTVRSQTELTAEEAAAALIAQGSDPEFFGLTCEG